MGPEHGYALGKNADESWVEYKKRVLQVLDQGKNTPYRLAQKDLFEFVTRALMHKLRSTDQTDEEIALTARELKWTVKLSEFLQGQDEAWGDWMAQQNEAEEAEAARQRNLEQLDHQRLAAIRSA